MANASMSKSKGAASGGFWQSLLHFGLYKPSQGRVTRQVTAVTLAVVFALMAWRLYSAFSSVDLVRYGGSLLVLVLGGWFSYRVVNFPRFADFLIAVEAEMHKVSWPSRTELVRSSAVVIISMFILALLLFGFDVIWRAVFRAIGII